MPFYTITLTQGAYDAPDAILGAIRSANEKAGYPPNDVFQRVLELPPTHLVIDRRYPDLPRDRSERLLVIEILTSTGTDPDRKARLLAETVDALAGIGVDTNDIILFSTQYDRAASSFGGGRTPPPLPH